MKLRFPIAIGLVLLLAPSASADVQGFLYGRVVMSSGSTYEGRLRWADEEAFWDDHFNSMKEELPYMEDAEDQGRERSRGRIRILGYRIDWGNSQWKGSRQFVARFGDIKEIRVTGDEDADIVMKNGQVHPISGYSNDVGGTIHVWDESLGNIELKWDRIDTITFMPTPSSLKVDAHRLRAKVMTDAGDFHGFVQWDIEECLSTDLLDGESEDGNMAIEMGRIRAIERRGRRSSLVELFDGRELKLRGTNDVNSEIRGIFVEDERYGRVKIPWDEFDRAEFEADAPSGRGYDEFGPGSLLAGRVTDIDGNTHAGRIVFDLDEAEGWEILHGSHHDVEYYIPFENIASIEPRDRDESMILLRNGEELRLEDSQDVSDRNDGILIFDSDDDRPVFLEWEEVERIEFDDAR